MITSLIIFAFLVYSICFFAADAKIFGCSTTTFLETPCDEEYLRNEGVIPIRNWLLRFRFFQKLFGCYFCTGAWAGPIAHGILSWYAYHNPTWRDSYFLWGPLHVQPLLIGLLMSILLGAVAGLLIDEVISKLER